MRVLPAETAMAIQERILAGASIRQIMGEFGVGKGTVSRYRAIAIKTSTLRPRRDRPQPILETPRSIVVRGDKNILRLQKDVEGLSGKVSFAVTLVRPRPPLSQRWPDLACSAAIERFVRLYRQYIAPVAS